MENGNLLHLYLEVWILVLSTERASCPPQQESHWAWLSRAGRSGWRGAWPGRRSAGGRPPGHTRPPSGPWRLGPGEGWRRYLCWVVSHLSGHPTPIRWQQLVWCSHLFDETRAAPFTVQNTLALMRLPEFWYYYVICKVFSSSRPCPLSMQEPKLQLHHRIKNTLAMRCRRHSSVVLIVFPSGSQWNVFVLLVCITQSAGPQR